MTISRRHVLTGLAAGTALCGPLVPMAQAQRPRVLSPADLVNDALIGFQRASGAPGISITVFNADEVLVQASSGYRIVDTYNRLSNEDPWYLGSATKTMTAALVGRLVDKGLISFDTALADALPDLRESMHDAFKPATVAHLLNHTSGMVPTVGMPRLLAVLDSRQPLREQRTQWARDALREKPLNEPGTVFVFSDLGYMVAGAIVERLTDMPWEDAMIREIFEPLSMESAGFGAPSSQDGINEPWGHYDDEGELVPHPPGPQIYNPPVLGPAFSVSLSHGDWSRFVMDQLAGARGRGTLLSPEIYRRQHAPTQRDEAMGWTVYMAGSPRRKLLAQARGNEIWHALMTLDIELDRGLVITANAATRKVIRAIGGLSSRLITDNGVWG